MLYDDEFSLFLIQVKSDSEFGALLNNDPTEFYRQNIRALIGDEKENVRAMVLRVCGHVPRAHCALNRAARLDQPSRRRH
jgi:hypothetical protein